MVKKKMSGIYKITCTADRRVYIGQSTNIQSRLKDHARRLSTGNHYNKKLQRAWDKYGSACFAFEVVEKCRCEFDILNEREIHWITEYNALDKYDGFNIASGGKNGYSLAGKTDEEQAEIFRKMSEWRKEYCKTHSSPFKGRHWSDADKQRIKESLSGEKGIWYGIKRPNHSEAMSGSRNPRAKAVLCETTGESFGCAKDAEAKYGITNSMILKCCKGIHKTGGKLSDGTKLVWKYLSESGEEIGQAI